MSNMAKTYMKLDGNLIPVSLDTAISKEEQTKTVSAPNFSSGNIVVTPDANKVLTQVTIVKDSDLVPANIVKDVNIFGVVGTAETGGGTSGGYTLRIIFYYNYTLDNMIIHQANGNEFKVDINVDNHTFGKYVEFENVTYIKGNPTHFSINYDGITETELNAGKTLTEDVWINMTDD